MRYFTIKRALQIAVMTAMLSFGVVQYTFAATLSDNILGELNGVGTNAGFAVRDAQQSLPYQIGILIRGIIGLLGVVFLVLVVFAGYKWMLAHGEPGEVKEAQKLLIHAIVGLIITVAAYALSNFVVNAISSAVFTP